ARHLKDLHARFGDWYLAWAAYNTGEGRVARALQRTGATDFWGLRESDHLAAETKRYVPKIIAAALNVKNPERYGFSGIDWLPPLSWEEVEVEGTVNLKAAARAVGADLEALQEINPELRFWCTPPHLKRYRLRIPKGSRERFDQRYRPLARDQQVTHTRHRLKSGETLSHVALGYKTSVQALLSANRIADPRRLRAGTSLIVPVRPCGGSAAVAAMPAPGPNQAPREKAKKAARSGPAPRVHVVQPGDSLWLAPYGTGGVIQAHCGQVRCGSGL
ncbi:MAG: LysM peptidoglycan-binding domain-containing protein, partial [Spirochaetota bacterium]